MPWVYVESFDAKIIRHAVSQKGVATNTEFWHDLQRLEHSEIRLVRGDKAPTISIKVFQAPNRPIIGKPKLWLYGLLVAESEADALVELAYVSRMSAALLAIALGVPIQKTGEFHLVQIREGEHGWLPHFEDRKFVGIDVLEGEPVLHEEGRDYEAIRTVPGSQPIIGSVLNDKNVSIFFQDVIKQSVGDKKADVGGLQLEIKEFETGIEWLGKNTEERGLLVDSMEFYVSAVAEKNPTLQFVMLWNIIELLVNSTETSRYLSKRDVKAMLENIEIDKDMLGRVKDSLARVTNESYQERVKQAFTNVFGDCLEESGQKIARLRGLRGKVLHPQGDKHGDGELIDALTELREVLDAHIKAVRTRLMTPPEPEKPKRALCRIVKNVQERVERSAPYQVIAKRLER